MKKTFALVLSVLLLVGLLAGCGGADKEIVGTWETSLEMANYLNEEFEAEGMQDYLNVSTFAVVMRFTFNQDGTYSCEADQAAFEQTVEGLKEEMKAGFVKYAEDMIADAGMDMTAEELFAQMGTSLDDLINDSFSAEDLSDVTDMAAAEGNYETKDGKLYLSDGKEYQVDPEIYEVYTIEGDKMTFVESVGGDADDDMAELYPLEFQRVG